MKFLGPLSSTFSGSRVFYADISQQLNTNETLTGLDRVVSMDSRMGISGAQILTGDIITSDGHTLSANKSVQFTALTSGTADFLNSVIIDYGTNLNTQDSTVVYIRVVPSI